MKAEALKERPDYELYKQNDVVSFYHLQLPRWLFEDSRYINLSLESKITYTMLFNRFQLSKHNGWINKDGEVFVIYTRKELSKRLNISEKRVSSAMSELTENSLIWERRCGRGFPNQIYIANIKTSLDDAMKSEGDPFDPAAKTTEADANYESEDTSNDSRTDETAVLDDNKPDKESDILIIGNDSFGRKNSENSSFPSSCSEMAAHEPTKHTLKNRQNGTSATSKTAVLEPPFCLPNKKDYSLNNTNQYNQSQSKSSPNNDEKTKDRPFIGLKAANKHTDRLTDTEVINRLLEQAEISFLDKDNMIVIKDAIERLYFMQSIRIGNAVYPTENIRSNLWRLDFFVVQDTVNRLSKNLTVKVRNSSAYVTTVLFNTIMEHKSDLVVDPYLNYLQSITKKDILQEGVG